ncbi:type IV secretory pathway VirB6 component (fragment) [Escherichia coli]
MSWIILVIAGLLEVVWAVGLKYTHGFSRLTPSVMEGANKRGNSSRLTQSFHFFMFEPIFSPVNALNQPI